jgi:hypothetical protein
MEKGQHIDQIDEPIGRLPAATQYRGWTDDYITNGISNYTNAWNPQERVDDLIIQKSELREFGSFKHIGLEKDTENTRAEFGAMTRIGAQILPSVDAESEDGRNLAVRITKYHKHDPNTEVRPSIGKKNGYVNSVVPYMKETAYMFPHNDAVANSMNTIREVNAGLLDEAFARPCDSADKFRDKINAENPDKIDHKEIAKDENRNAIKAKFVEQLLERGKDADEIQEILESLNEQYNGREA